jgi:hypothetical protein
MAAITTVQAADALANARVLDHTYLEAYGGIVKAAGTFTPCIHVLDPVSTTGTWKEVTDDA